MFLGSSQHRSVTFSGTLGLVYSHSLAGNARVAGLQKQLGLTDHQYQICVTVLFVYVVCYLVPAIFTEHHLRPYILAELPSNLLLRRIGPKLLMPTLLTIWGIMVTLQGEFLDRFSNNSGNADRSMKVS